jgi:hypothetical protein
VRRKKASSALEEMLADKRVGQIVDMRSRGLGWRQIAQALGYANPSTPHRVFARYHRLHRAAIHTSIETLVMNEVRGIEAAEARCWTIVERANGPTEKEAARTYEPETQLKALETLTKLKAAKAKLLGLNKPDRIEVEHRAENLSEWLTKLQRGEIHTPRELLDDGAPAPRALPQSADDAAFEEIDASALHDEPH